MCLTIFAKNPIFKTITLTFFLCRTTELNICIMAAKLTLRIMNNENNCRLAFSTNSPAHNVSYIIDAHNRNNPIPSTARKSVNAELSLYSGSSKVFPAFIAEKTRASIRFPGAEFRIYMENS